MENGELKMKMKNYPHWLPLTQGEKRTQEDTTM